jgi:hypothetical protein
MSSPVRCSVLPFSLAHSRVGAGEGIPIAAAAIVPASAH